MADLTTKARNALPAKDFAMPSKRAYPIPDAAHAANAKARASQAVNAGRMAPSAAAGIKAAANKVMAKPGHMTGPKSTAHSHAHSGWGTKGC